MLRFLPLSFCAPRSNTFFKFFKCSREFIIFLCCFIGRIYFEALALVFQYLRRNSKFHPLFYKILIPFRIKCIKISFIKSLIWINLNFIWINLK